MSTTELSPTTLSKQGPSLSPSPHDCMETWEAVCKCLVKRSNPCGRTDACPRDPYLPLVWSCQLYNVLLIPLFLSQDICLTFASCDCGGASAGKGPFEHLRLEVRGTNTEGAPGCNLPSLSSPSTGLPLSAVERWLSPHPGIQLKTPRPTQNSLADTSSACCDKTFTYMTRSVFLSLSVCLLTGLPLPPSSILIWPDSAALTPQPFGRGQMYKSQGSQEVRTAPEAR